MEMLVLRTGVLLAGFLSVGVAVAETFSAFAPGEVTVGGEIGRRMSVTAEKLLHKTDIEQVFFFDAIAVNGVAHVYTWIQRALAQLQYAEATGRDLPVLTVATDELYRRAFGDFLSISGSMSGGPLWGEIWDDSQVGLGKWGETCVSAYLLRCTAERMRLYPETRSGDLFERVLYNAFFGAQSADGAGETRFELDMVDRRPTKDGTGFCIAANATLVCDTIWL